MFHVEHLFVNQLVGCKIIAILGQKSDIKMFQKNQDAKQLDLLNNIFSQLNGKSLDQYTDAGMWHNVFRNNVLSKIDENIFSVLFDEKNGAPNYPVNILIGMMVLKEGFGWSDSELFSSVRFNLLVRSALGMHDLNEKTVSESCYYLFRKRIFEHEQSTGEDLLGKAFAGITGGQSMLYEVDGKAIRMDSKLLGSNIARISRFQLVHGVLGKFYSSLSQEQKLILTPELEEGLQGLFLQDGEKIVYRSKNGELEDLLFGMGCTMYQLTCIYKGSGAENYGLLSKVFEQQFSLSNGQVQLRPREELKASNIQSPEDMDADYRKKGEQEIFGGYHANITETCNDEGLNLITVPEVGPATAHEKDFYQNGVEKSGEVTGDKVEKTHTDGAYHSQPNKGYNDENGIDMVLTGMQGKKGRFGFGMSDGVLVCFDRETGSEYQLLQTHGGKSYKIKDSDGKTYYFSKQQVENDLFRQEAEARPIEELNKRNNVEATIFQVSYFTRNNKVRYRGMKKVKAWLYMRCLWINLVRIKNFMGKLAENGAKSALELIKKHLIEVFSNKQANPKKIEFSISS